MAVPEYLLNQSLVRLRYPVVTDAYNNEAVDFDAEPATLQFKGWLQQDNRNMIRQDAAAKQGRNESDERWLLITNETDIQWQDRITGVGGPFVVYSAPEPCFTPGGYHHLEATLQKVVD